MKVGATKVAGSCATRFFSASIPPDDVPTTTIQPALRMRHDTIRQRIEEGAWAGLAPAWLRETRTLMHMVIRHNHHLDRLTCSRRRDFLIIVRDVDRRRPSRARSQQMTRSLRRASHA